MGTRAEDVSAVIAAVERAVERLPAATVAALADHPSAVSVALATAADVLEHTRERPEGSAPSVPRDGAPGTGPELVSEEEARERLSRRTRGSIVEDTLGSDEVADLLGLKGRASVLKRLREQRLIGIEGERRGVRYPRAQFDPEGRVWPGVAEVRALFPDAFAAWSWLTTGTAALDGRTPLERLRAGETEAVTAAAKGERQGDFT